MNEMKIINPRKNFEKIFVVYYSFSKRFEYLKLIPKINIE